MASTPQFATLINTAAALVSTANTNRDGTGAIVDIVTMRIALNGGQGGRIDGIVVDATGTTTAGMIRIYRKSAAAAYRLLREIAVSAATPSGTVKAWTIPTTEGADINGLLQFAGGITLQPGEAISISTHNAESFHATVFGGEF
jgi:hypothetical protein